MRFRPLDISEGPLYCCSRAACKSLGEVVDAKFDFCSNAKMDIVPSRNIVKVHPKLRFGEEDVVGIEPWTSLFPECDKAVERTPFLEEFYFPVSRELKIVYTRIAI